MKNMKKKKNHYYLFYYHCDIVQRYKNKTLFS